MSSTISRAEFARLAGIGDSTAYRWFRDGKLDSIEAGRKRLDRKLALEWIKLNVKAEAKP